jgi:hypothetical protein
MPSEDGSTDPKHVKAINIYKLFTLDGVNNH